MNTKHKLIATTLLIVQGLLLATQLTCIIIDTQMLYGFGLWGFIPVVIINIAIVIVHKNKGGVR